MSFRSFPQQGIWMGSSSSGTGRGMEPGFGIMQALGRSLESSMADQELNAATARNSHRAACVADERSNMLAHHRELTVAHVPKISGTCHHLLKITEALRDDPTPKSRTPIRRIRNEQK
jgi:hypothetical protein